MGELVTFPGGQSIKNVYLNSDVVRRIHKLSNCNVDAQVKNWNGAAVEYRLSCSVCNSGFALDFNKYNELAIGCISPEIELFLNNHRHEEKSKADIVYKVVTEKTERKFKFNV